MFLNISVKTKKVNFMSMKIYLKKDLIKLLIYLCYLKKYYQEKL